MALPLRCCLYTTSAILLCLGVIIVYSLGNFLRTAHRQNTQPFAEDLHNSSLTTLPVVPLVHHNTFDIAVSLWLKPSETVILSRRIARLAAKAEQLEDGVEKLSDEELKRVEAGELHEDERDDLLYSDILFRGLKLSDRHVAVTLDYEIPTERLCVGCLLPSCAGKKLIITVHSCGLNLTSDDLRASFVLIPNSPSPLDRAISFSSSIPEIMYQEPVRAWP